MRDTLGIILARKGSKRLPGKNNESLGNDKLINIVVAKAKKAGITDIWLCTDDQALRYTGGVTIISRPEQLSGDNVPGEAVISHILNRHGPDVDRFKYFCILQVTAPLFKPHRLKQALTRVHNNNLPGCVSVNPAFEPSGNFYIINIDLFRHNYESRPEQGLWIPGIHIMKLSWKECVDIDYIHDLRIAQAVYEGKVIK